VPQRFCVAAAPLVDRLLFAFAHDVLAGAEVFDAAALGVKQDILDHVGGEVLDRVEPVAVGAQLPGQPDHPRTRVIAHVLPAPATAVLGVEVADVRATEDLAADLACGALVPVVRMEVVVAFRPPAGLGAGKPLVLESLEPVARRLRVLVAAVHVVEHDVGVGLEPVGVGDRDQAQQLVLGAEFRGERAALVLVAEVVVIERVVAHGEAAARPLGGRRDPHAVEPQLAQAWR
jgi:hypothetical protein